MRNAAIDRDALDALKAMTIANTVGVDALSSCRAGARGTMDSKATRSAELAFMRREVARLAARRIVEIGAFKGEGTVALCGAAAPHAGHVVVIDPMSWGVELCVNVLGVPVPRRLARWTKLPLLGFEGAFWRTLRRAGHHEDVTLLRGSSTDPRMLARRHPLLEQLDLLVVDGDRGYDAVWSDLHHWGARVRPGGTILVRGVCAAHPSVVKAFVRAGREPGVRASTPPNAGTLGKVEIIARSGP